VLFHVIPAKAGIQSRSERDFSRLEISWTPVFTGETNRRRFFHSFPFSKGEKVNFSTVDHPKALLPFKKRGREGV
jgi:hypothetical protein